MQFHVQHDGVKASIAIEGEMTIYAAEELKTKLMTHFGACNDIELNLAGVTEIDSAGQQLLVFAKLESMIENKTLRLTHHSPAVVEVIDLCGLAVLFGDPILIHPEAA